MDINNLCIRFKDEKLKKKMSDILHFGERIIEKITSILRLRSIFSNPKGDHFSELDDHSLNTQKTTNCKNSEVIHNHYDYSEENNSKMKYGEEEHLRFIQNSRSVFEHIPKQELYFFELKNLPAYINAESSIKDHEQYYYRKVINEISQTESDKCDSDVNQLQSNNLLSKYQYKGFLNESELSHKITPFNNPNAPVLNFDEILLSHLSFNNSILQENEIISPLKHRSEYCELLRDLKLSNKEKNSYQVCNNDESEETYHLYLNDEFDILIESLKDIVFLRKTERDDDKDRKIVKSYMQDEIDDATHCSTHSQCSFVTNNFNLTKQICDSCKKDSGISSTMCSANLSFDCKNNMSFSDFVISQNLRQSMKKSEHSVEFPQENENNIQFNKIDIFSNSNEVANYVNKIQLMGRRFDSNRSLCAVNIQNELMETNTSNEISVTNENVSIADFTHYQKVTHEIHPENNLEGLNRSLTGEITSINYEKMGLFGTSNENYDSSANNSLNIEKCFENTNEGYKETTFGPGGLLLPNTPEKVLEIGSSDVTSNFNKNKSSGETILDKETTESNLDFLKPSLSEKKRWNNLKSMENFENANENYSLAVSITNGYFEKSNKKIDSTIENTNKGMDRNCNSLHCFKNLPNDANVSANANIKNCSSRKRSYVSICTLSANKKCRAISNFNKTFSSPNDANLHDNKSKRRNEEVPSLYRKNVNTSFINSEKISFDAVYYEVEKEIEEYDECFDFPLNERKKFRHNNYSEETKESVSKYFEDFISVNNPVKESFLRIPQTCPKTRLTTNVNMLNNCECADNKSKENGYKTRKEKSCKNISKYCEDFITVKPAKEGFFHIPQTRAVPRPTTVNAFENSGYTNNKNKGNSCKLCNKKNCKNISNEPDTKSMPLKGRSKFHVEAKLKQKNSNSKTVKKLSNCICQKQGKKDSKSWIKTKNEKTKMSSSYLSFSSHTYSCSGTFSLQKRHMMKSRYDTQFLGICQKEQNLSKRNSKKLNEMSNVKILNASCKLKNTSMFFYNSEKCNMNFSSRKSKYYTKEINYGTQRKGKFDKYSLAIHKSLSSSKMTELNSILLPLSYEGATLDDLLPTSKYEKYQKLLSSIEYPLTSCNYKENKKRSRCTKKMKF